MYLKFECPAINSIFFISRAMMLVHILVAAVSPLSILLCIYSNGARSYARCSGVTAFRSMFFRQACLNLRCLTQVATELCGSS